MAYIVLEKDIFEEFLKFVVINKDYNRDIIKNLFNHFKPFLITHTQLANQLKVLLGDEDPSIPVWMNINSFWEFRECNNSSYSDNFYKEMLEQSKYKILLKQEDSPVKDLGYYTICIEDKPTHTFATKLESIDDRDNAKKHIMSLMKNAKSIIIIDKYLIPDNDKDKVVNDLIKWFEDSKLNKKIEINLQFGTKKTKEEDFEEIAQKFKSNKYENINCSLIKDDIHDRYIKIDNNIIINLTSGLINLFNNKKDLTYIILEK